MPNYPEIYPQLDNERVFKQRDTINVNVHVMYKYYVLDAIASLDFQFECQ